MVWVNGGGWFRIFGNVEGLARGHFDGREILFFQAHAQVLMVGGEAPAARHGCAGFQVSPHQNSSVGAQQMDLAFRKDVS